MNQGDKARPSRAEAGGDFFPEGHRDEGTMTPAEAFGLSPAEGARVAAAPVPGNEDDWRTFASGVHEQLVKAYAEGEIALERALEGMWACLLGCRLTDRITLLALTARRALQHPPAARKGKRQPNPTWVRYSAAALVQMFHEGRPAEARPTR